MGTARGGAKRFAAADGWRGNRVAQPCLSTSFDSPSSQYPLRKAWKVLQNLTGFLTCDLLTGTV